MTEEGPGLTKELVELYLKDAPDLLEEMRRAIANGEAGVLTRAAHTLKGNSDTVGATKLSALSLELQRLAETASMGRAPALLLQVESEFQ